jgi:hypothetical protein
MQAAGVAPSGRYTYWRSQRYQLHTGGDFRVVGCNPSAHKARKRDPSPDVEVAPEGAGAGAGAQEAHRRLIHKGDAQGGRAEACNCPGHCSITDARSVILCRAQAVRRGFWAGKTCGHLAPPAMASHPPKFWANSAASTQSPPSAPPPRTRRGLQGMHASKPQLSSWVEHHWRRQGQLQHPRDSEAPFHPEHAAAACW